MKDVMHHLSHQDQEWIKNHVKVKVVGLTTQIYREKYWAIVVHDSDELRWYSAADISIVYATTSYQEANKELQERRRTALLDRLIACHENNDAPVLIDPFRHEVKSDILMIPLKPNEGLAGGVLKYFRKKAAIYSLHHQIQEQERAENGKGYWQAMIDQVKRERII